jgi:hypothetical protein
VQCHILRTLEEKMYNSYFAASHFCQFCQPNKETFVCCVRVVLFCRHVCFCNVNCKIKSPIFISSLFIPRIASCQQVMGPVTLSNKYFWFVFTASRKIFRKLSVSHHGKRISPHTEAERKRELGSLEISSSSYTAI